MLVLDLLLWSFFHFCQVLELSTISFLLYVYLIVYRRYTGSDSSVILPCSSVFEIGVRGRYHQFSSVLTMPCLIFQSSHAWSENTGAWLVWWTNNIGKASTLGDQESKNLLTRTYMDSNSFHEAAWFIDINFIYWPWFKEVRGPWRSFCLWQVGPCLISFGW